MVGFLQVTIRPHFTAPRRKYGYSRRIGLGGAAGLLVLSLTGCALGTYRMPYADGTIISVARDHLTHSSPDGRMYDLVAVFVNQPGTGEIVAAAPGVVRFIDDGNDTNCSDASCDNNYVWIEHQVPHPCPSDNCNEWTIYAHFVKDSVTVDAGLSPGDSVEAGDFLGFEGDIGFAPGGVHLHWHVAVLPPTISPDLDTGYYEGYVEAINGNPEVIPLVCHAAGSSVLSRNDIHIAGGCGSSPQLESQAALEALERKRGTIRSASPVGVLIERISRITDEGVVIARKYPALMERTRKVVVRLEPAIQDLLELGRARLSAAELKLILDLADAFEAHGSDEMRAVLAEIREQLENPNERRGLGLILKPPLAGLD